MRSANAPMISAGRDDGEHHLEDHERLVRDGGGVVRRWAPRRRPSGTTQSRLPITRPDVRAERQAVADEHPLHADQAHDHEALHQDREHVLPAHQPAVEERQPRRHQQHQRGARQHPGRVAGVDGRRTAAPRPRRGSGWSGQGPAAFVASPGSIVRSCLPPGVRLVSTIWEIATDVPRGKDDTLNILDNIRVFMVGRSGRPLAIIVTYM